MGEGDSRLGRLWAKGDGRFWATGRSTGDVGRLGDFGRLGDPQNLDLLAPPFADAHWAVGPTPRSDKGRHDSGTRRAMHPGRVSGANRPIGRHGYLTGQVG